jgi:hypothetical protein
MANPVRVLCNATDISSSVDWTTLDMVSVLTKEVGTLKFSVRIGAGQTFPVKTVPQLNNAIQLFDSSGIIFGGTVTETEVTVAGLMLLYQITCTDHSYLFDGTLVKKNYAMMDPHDIVLDLVANFAPGKGFTTTHVQTANFLIPSIKFNYQQPTKCLESLAKLIGWDWYIDPAKDIHFFLGDVESAVGEGGTAPINIDETSGQIEWNTLDVDQNLQNMKNSVFVIGGTYSKTFTALNTPDVYTTVGGTVVYSIGYPYSKSTITVTLDGVTQTVGIDQQTDPTTVQVLYNDTNRFVKFTADPGSTHTLKIFGAATIPIIAHASDPVSIATYGEFQDVIVDSKISSVVEAQQRAQAEIFQFGQPVYDVKFNTIVAGCAIGQTIILNSPKLGILNYPLIIKRIEATVFVPGAQGKLEYQIEAIGSDTVTFVDLMTTLLQQEANQTAVDDSTVTQNLEPIAEGVTVLDAVTATSTTKPYKWGPTGSPIMRWAFSRWN